MNRAKRAAVTNAKTFVKIDPLPAELEARVRAAATVLGITPEELIERCAIRALPAMEREVGIARSPKGKLLRELCIVHGAKTGKPVYVVIAFGQG